MQLYPLGDVGGMALYIYTYDMEIKANNKEIIGELANPLNWIVVVGSNEGNSYEREV